MAASERANAGAHHRASLGGLTRGLAVLFGTLWLSACAVGPDYKEPKVPVTEKFEGTALTTYSQEESITRFWEQFGDDTLNTLVSDALAANHDLRIALSRFYEARAARGESRFDLAPTITASGGKPTLAVTLPGAKHIQPSNRELEDLGVKLNVHPSDMLGASVHGMRLALASLRGGPQPPTGAPGALDTAIRRAEYLAEDARWSPDRGRA